MFFTCCFRSIILFNLGTLAVTATQTALISKGSLSPDHFLNNLSAVDILARQDHPGSPNLPRMIPLKQQGWVNPEEAPNTNLMVFGAIPMVVVQRVIP